MAITSAQTLAIRSATVSLATTSANANPKKKNNKKMVQQLP